MSQPIVTILGSAAAEGVPAYFCDCRVCREAAARGGREIRNRASYNFGGALQIDYGPDIMQAFQRFRDRMNAVRHVIITHPHEDHLSAMEFLFHGRGFCNVPSMPGVPLTIHGTGPTRERVRHGFHCSDETEFGRRLASAGLEFQLFRPLDTFEIPDIGATVRAFPANHAPGLEPVVFLVTMGGRTAFFCNDTGYLPEASWEALAKLSGQVRIDVAILDDCFGLRECREHHMGATTVLETFDRLGSLGLVDDATTKVVNHFSHNAGQLQDELEAFFLPRGILVGYDGMEL